MGSGELVTFEGTPNGFKLGGWGFALHPLQRPGLGAGLFPHGKRGSSGDVLNVEHRVGFGDSRQNERCGP